MPRNIELDSELITLPAGEFMMGETPGDKFANDTERPRHRVRVCAFRLGRFPVTNAAFRDFRPGFAPNEPDDVPVTNVTWHDALAFCDWLGTHLHIPLRLPTEAEWEYAARAETASLYPWGDEVTTTVANYLYSENGTRVGPGHPTPAGTYKPNIYNLYDLLGNVAEWTSDHWHPNYHSEPDGSSTLHDHRVVRGGAWDYLPRLLRPSWRDSCSANSFRDNLGFRVASSVIQIP